MQHRHPAPHENEPRVIAVSATRQNTRTAWALFTGLVGVSYAWACLLLLQ